MNKLTHAQEHAETYGGRCLSGRYLASKALLLWECEYGHRFMHSLYSVQQGMWCPECAKEFAIQRQRAKGALRAVKVGQNLKVACINPEVFVNQHSVLAWKCECGNRFNLSYKNIVRRECVCRCRAILNKGEQ